VKKRNVHDDMKQASKFCEYCVPQNRTVVHVLFRTG